MNVSALFPRSIKTADRATGYRQIWSTVAGYEELKEEFQPIKNGDVFHFGMNNTVFLFLFIKNISPFPCG